MIQFISKFSPSKYAQCVSAGLSSGSAVLMLVAGLFMAPQVGAADYQVELCEVQASNNAMWLHVCDPAWTPKNGCGDGTAPSIILHYSDPGSDAMVATALTAFTLKSPVVLRLNPGVCGGQYDRTTMVKLVRP